MGWTHRPLPPAIPKEINEQLEELKKLANSIEEPLNVILKALEVAEAFYIAGSDVFVALVGIIIDQLEALITDIFSTGVYRLIMTPYNVPEVARDPFDIPLLTPARAIKLAIASLDDEGDTPSEENPFKGRPQFSDGSKVAGFGFLLTATDASQFAELLRAFAKIWDVRDLRKLLERIDTQINTFSLPEAQRVTSRSPDWATASLRSIGFLRDLESQLLALLELTRGYLTIVDAAIKDLIAALKKKVEQLLALIAELSALIDSLKLTILQSGCYIWELEEPAPLPQIANLTLASKQDPLASRRRLANVAKIVTQSPHSLVDGQEVSITGMTDDSYNIQGAVATVINDTTLTYPNPGADEGLQPVDSRNRQSNVATLVMSSPHGLTSGAVIDIVSMTDPSYDATDVFVSVPDANTLTYPNTGPDDIINVATVNRKREANLAILTVATPHTLVSGQLVDVSGLSDPSFNGTGLSVTTVLSPTSFSYSSPGPDDTIYGTVSRARTANLASIETSTPHNLVSGQEVDISNMADSSYNDPTAIITVIDPTRFFYSSTGPDEGVTPDTAGVIDIHHIVDSGGTVVSDILETGGQIYKPIADTAGVANYVNIKLGGLYFNISSVTAQYYFWFQSGIDVDPTPGGIGVQVNISGLVSRSDVYTAIAGAGNAVVEGDKNVFDWRPDIPQVGLLEVENIVGGSVLGVPGGGSTDIVFDVTQEGQEPEGIGGNNLIKSNLRDEELESLTGTGYSMMLLCVGGGASRKPVEIIQDALKG